MTYKQKNRLLLGGMVLLCLVTYWLGVKNTLNLYSDVKEQRQRFTDLETYPQELKANINVLSELNLSVEQYVRDKDFNQDEILEELTEFCDNHKLVIRSFPKAKLNKKNDLLIETHVVKVEGVYVNLVKMLHHIENEAKLGRIASSEFEIQKDRKTKRKRLVLTFYLQNIRDQS